jgi:LPS-assembly protein
MRLGFLSRIVSGLALGLLLGGVGAAAMASDSPVNLVADEVGYDRDLGIYVARGHVEMRQDDRVVVADTVTYNERSKTISASGNVAMLLPSGDTLFGNYIDVTDDFKDGAIQGFRALMSDKSRLAAKSAQRIGGTKMQLNDAVYTPCLPCKTDPSRQPVWQIKAHDVVRDEVAGTVTYHDAWMEMFGVPVFYTPYFRHADIGVKRQSGLLSPSVSVSSGKSGVQYRHPYFITMGPDKDLTVTPIVRVGGGPTNAGAVGLLEYRQRLQNGTYNLAFSGTSEDREADSDKNHIMDDKFRGHVAGAGLFELNRDWRAGFDFKNTTDKTYLRQYHLGTADWLQDQVWTEGFFGRSYFDARGYGFQTTDRDFNDQDAPIVAPLISYNFVGEPSSIGSYWGFDANTMNLIRRDGRDSFRLSALPSWTLPYTSAFGDIYELKLSVEGDLYVVNDVDKHSDSFDQDKGTDEFSGVTGRAFPQASMKWRYPFVRPGETITQVFQPITQLVLSPDCCNTGKIPNEDSRTFEWDDTKVFDAGRFAGLDRVDSGSRVNYGFEWTGYGAHGGFGQVFLGQSYQFLRGDDERDGSGIDKDLTDLVGRVTISPGEYFDATYRFRFDADSGVMERQEVALKAGVPLLNVSVNYAQLNGNEEFNDREQVSTKLSTAFADYWSASLGTSYDIQDTEINSVSAGLGYNDECFGMNLLASYAPDGDNLVTSGKYAAFVNFTFKNLGSIGSGF